MKKLSFIYFDVGGVVVLDYSKTNKWEDMLLKMGVNKSNEDEFNKIWDKYHDRICIDTEVDVMVPEFRQKLGLKLPDDFSFLAEFVNRFDPNPSLWPIYQGLKMKTKIGLLTNIYVGMLDMMYKKDGLMPDVEWDLIIDSTQVKLQKPDRAIFKLAQEKANCLPEEILFVENTEKHLETARNFGWGTFEYDPANAEESSKELGRLLKNFNLL